MCVRARARARYCSTDWNGIAVKLYLDYLLRSKLGGITILYYHMVCLLVVHLHLCCALCVSYFVACFILTLTRAEMASGREGHGRSGGEPPCQSWRDSVMPR